MSTEPFLRVEDVTTDMRRGRWHLERVSFRVNKGEAVALIGPNGGGKTTLLSLLAGLRSPDRGRVLVEGQDLSTFGYEAMRAHRTRLGYVFETGGFLGNRTVLQNIMLPLAYHGKSSTADEEIEGRARDLGREIGLDEDVLDLAGANANNAIQRTAMFARAFILEPDLLLVDEPQASLSPRVRSLIAKAIDRRRAERRLTVVYTDHDGEMTPFIADRRFYVYKGLLSDRPSDVGAEEGIFDDRPLSSLRADDPSSSEGTPP